MTREEAIKLLVNATYSDEWQGNEDLTTAHNMAIKALEQEPGKITVEEYRQRMIQAFHNADCDELIAICVLPTEKEFEHLEWLLKNHYKKDTCEDCVSRQEVLKGYIEVERADGVEIYSEKAVPITYINNLPPVTPTRKKGRWILTDDDFVYCSECEDSYYPRPIDASWYYCPNCGAEMESEE